MTTLNFIKSLQEIKQQSNYRNRLVHTSRQSPVITIDNQEYLAFCSNDYLGLAANTEIATALKASVDDSGIGSGGSHLILGHHQAHNELEKKLAKFTNRSKALVFANGYMANIAIISTLLKRNDAVFMDRLNHASMYDACMMSPAKLYRYKHNNLDDLQKKLSQVTATNKLIISDSVFSMDGDIAPIAGLIDIAKEQQALLAIDDAHGFGVLGNNGGGITELLQCSEQDVPILMATFGKALGTYGAFIAGSSELIDFFIQRARPYIYTTALPPSLAVATLTSLNIVARSQHRRKQLNNLIEYFQKSCKKLKINILNSTTAIQPLIVGSSKNASFLSNELKKMHILVTAIRPPTVPEGTARLRITLNALHTKSHIDQLLAALITSISKLKQDNNHEN